MLRSEPLSEGPKQRRTQRERFLRSRFDSFRTDDVTDNEDLIAVHLEGVIEKRVVAPRRDAPPE